MSFELGDKAIDKNGRLMWIVRVSGQGRDGMNDGVPRATISGMVNINNSHKQIINGFNDSALTEPKLIGQVYEDVFHVLSNFGNQLNTFSQKMLREFSQIAFIRKALTLKVI